MDFVMVKVDPTVNNAVCKAKQFTETEKRFLEGEKRRPVPPSP